MHSTKNSNHTPNPDDLLECAEAAARAGGMHALRHRERRNEIAARFAHDIKLQLDRESQDAAESVIRRRFPNSALLGEETPSARGQNALRWIIDPIDGTVNYFHGLPLWCCSVAAEWQGRIVAGAVYAPVGDQCYTAHIRSHAACNGRPIRVSSTKRLREAVVLTGLNKRNGLLTDSIAVFKALAFKTRKLRIMGSAALDLCHVASGQAEAFFESGIYYWDIAAAGLIVERAGGISEILAQKRGYCLCFLAGNRNLHKSIKRIVTAQPEQKPA